MAILEADGKCEACGRAPMTADLGEGPQPCGDDTCHVCGGPATAKSYWEALIGHELPDEGPMARAVSMAAQEIGVTSEKTMDERGFRRFCLAAGISSRGERERWRDLAGEFIRAESAGGNLAHWELLHPPKGGK